MNATPNWLKKVYSERGTDTSLEDAQLLYRPALSWDEHHALCVRGDLAELLSQLEQEDHPIERECFYFSTIEMTYRDHPQTAIAFGIRYVEEFYKTPEPFGPGHPISGQILKRLVLLLDPFNYEDDEDYRGSREHAIWVCQVGLHFGLADGTKRGFQGRLQTLQEQSTNDT